MNLDLNALDTDLQHVPRSKTNSFDVAEKNDKTPEDDIAIAEAIAQVEKELKEKEPNRFIEQKIAAPPRPEEDAGYKENGPFSFVALGIAVVGGVVLARLALRFF